MSVEIVSGVLAFCGAAVGSALAYLGTRAATKTEREARRREEWGRRFTSALEAVNSTDSTSRATGRALLVELLDSPLATEDDRRAARAVLEAAATHNEADLRLLLPPGSNLDDIDVVRDNGNSDGTEGGQP